jgi:hypothetical protein
VTTFRDDDDDDDDDASFARLLVANRRRDAAVVVVEATLARRKPNPKHVVVELGFAALLTVVRAHRSVERVRASPRSSIMIVVDMYTDRRRTRRTRRRLWRRCGFCLLFAPKQTMKRRFITQEREGWFDFLILMHEIALHFATRDDDDDARTTREKTNGVIIHRCARVRRGHNARGLTPRRRE